MHNFFQKQAYLISNFMHSNIQFVQYAKYLYNLLNNVSNEDNHAIDELLKQFEVNNIKLSLSRKDTLYVEFQITCLKQYIVY